MELESLGLASFRQNIIKRLEQRTGLSIIADGLPAELEDDEPEEQGYEVKVGSG